MDKSAIIAMMVKYMRQQLNMNNQQPYAGMRPIRPVRPKPTPPAK